MLSSLTTQIRERRGHDRVQDAVFLEVLPEGQTNGAGSDAPNCKVSLSASGIAFADSAFYEPGSQITISLVLFPSKWSLVCPITIVSAGDASEVAMHVDGLLLRLAAVA